MRNKGIARRVIRRVYLALRALLPRNRFGDDIAAFLSFVATHRRLPRDRRYFNDVLYRMKTSDELYDPLRVFTSDKELVKLYVRAIVGEKYNVPTIAVLRSPEEVDRYDFPARCCIKPTQASGPVIVRIAGEPIDRATIKRWFALDHYRKTREANYRGLRPKVIVEPVIFGGADLRDYKLFCVNSSLKMLQVDLERHIEHKRAVFDRNWNAQDYDLAHPRPDMVPERPANFAEMIEVAEKLAVGFDFIRVDLYTDGQTCLVGELTHCHGGACEIFTPVSAEGKAGELLFG